MSVNKKLLLIDEVQVDESDLTKTIKKYLSLYYLVGVKVEMKQLESSFTGPRVYPSYTLQIYKVGEAEKEGE